MIDSTNPRIMADNIRKLSEASGSGGSTVVPNPEGEATGNLSSLGIDGSKYTIPVYSPPEYSTTEYDTGKKYVDGRSIYGKDIEVAQDFIAGTVEITTGVTDAHILTDLKCFCNYGSEEVCLSGIYSNPGSANELISFKNFVLSSGKARFNIGSDYSGQYAVKRIFLHIEYVKAVAPTKTTKSKK